MGGPGSGRKKGSSWKSPIIKMKLPSQKEIVDRLVKSGHLKTTKTGKVRKFGKTQKGMYKKYYGTPD